MCRLLGEAVTLRCSDREGRRAGTIRCKESIHNEQSRGVVSRVMMNKDPGMMRCGRRCPDSQGAPDSTQFGPG